MRILRDLRADLALHRTHARQTTTTLRAMHRGDIDPDQATAAITGKVVTRQEYQTAQLLGAWEAGGPVRDAALLAAFVTADREGVS